MNLEPSERSLQDTAEALDWITNTCALRALADPALFPRARVGEWGSAVEWITDELDLRADNLRHLAIEQAGEHRP